MSKEMRAAMIIVILLLGVIIVIMLRETSGTGVTIKAPGITVKARVSEPLPQETQALLDEYQKLQDAIDAKVKVVNEEYDKRIKEHIDAYKKLENRY